jgi:hypothetical protein
MRPRVVLAACIAAVLGVILLAIPGVRSALSLVGSRGTAVAAPGFFPPDPTGKVKTAQILTQPVPPQPALRAPTNPGMIKSPAGASFFSWAFLDRHTEAVTGSANSGDGTNSTESMVKAWITGDYLRQQGDRAVDQAVIDELTLMIIDSNDNIAEKYYEKDGGNAVMQRMISMCGLTNTKIFPFWWAKTQMTPVDAIRYGKCVANGTAAGAKWTDWLLTTMRKVRGGVADQISVTKQGGRWGIIDAIPADMAQEVSIKNGWTAYGDGWHVNCLAIHRDWVLSVMVRIGSLQLAANACRSVAQQLLITPDI